MAVKGVAMHSEVMTDGAVTLRNGTRMPCPGYGTYKLPDDDTTVRNVAGAIACGYRHIDCAAFYKNEKNVGLGIREGMRVAGCERDDLFITSKVWVSDRSYNGALESLNRSLNDLGLGYLDLLLIHWPADIHEHEDWERVNIDTWKAFTEMYGDGSVRAIGVSNFHPMHLEALMQTEVPPMVNQIEYHPGYAQAETVEYCRENGIVLEAWSPLGRGRMLNDPVITDIADSHGRSAAQICLRWCVQNGVVPLPKASSTERIRENSRIFDFGLTDEEMKRIDALPLSGWSGHTPENIHFK